MQVIGNRVQAEVGVYEKIKQALDDLWTITVYEPMGDSTYESVDAKFQ